MDHHQAPTAHPLAWPLGWERHPYRKRARFSRDMTLARALEFLDAELVRLQARSPIVSTNLTLKLDGSPRSGQAQPRDPGVALYFTLRDPKGRDAPTVLACDTWDRVEHNVYAIGLHVEAMRGMARWGVGNLRQAFTGYAALPPASRGDRSWDQVLGVQHGASAGEIRAAYTERVKKAHPDQGGSVDQLMEVRAAWKTAIDLGLVGEEVLRG